MLDALLQDIRYALRGFARSPGFTLTVVITLALGIGANATMFGVLDALLLRPPRYVQDPDDVVRVYIRSTSRWSGTFTTTTTSVPTYEALRAGVPGFASTAAFFDRGLSLGRGAEARAVKVAAVSHTYFPMLGVRPAFGRFFGADEDRPGAQGTAVLGHGFWHARFSGDSAVLGRALPIGRGTYTVTGVAPEGFIGANQREPDIWLPLSASVTDVFFSAEAAATALTSHGSFWIGVVARLTPGADRAATAASATTVYKRNLVAAGSDDTVATILLGPMQRARGPKMSDNAKVALWVGAVAAVVLLVACANVANLLLARGVRRRREIAVRLGLGATRYRIAVQLLVESLVLGLLGGAAALLVTTWGGSLVRAFLLPDLPATEPILDWRVLLFMAAAALLAGSLAGVAPALHSSRVDLSAALKDAGRSITSGHGRLRAALLAAQVAFTIVLLVGAGLFVRSLRNVQALDLGVDIERVLVATVDLGSVGMARNASNAMHLGLLERARTFPGVVAAAAGVGTPFGWSHGMHLRASGSDSIPHVQDGGPYLNAVTPDYFQTLGLGILRGRGFTDADGPVAGRVAVVGRTFARRVWPDREALGQCLYLGSDDSTCVQVVGVTEDARRGRVIEGEVMQCYVPFAQYWGSARIDGLLIRTAAGGRAAAEGVQRALQRAEPNLPYVQVQSLEEIVAPQFRSWRLGATMFTAFGLLALAIAAMGLYGVTAYGVSQRTQEIGVRMALGASGGQVLRMVVWQGVRATLAGAALGAVGAWALGRGLASLLYGVSPGDPLVFASVTLLLIAVALLASYLPARRAAGVDPAVALRSE
jgi:predicted permease